MNDIDKYLEKLSVEKDDILVFRGAFEEDAIHQIAKVMSIKGMNNIMLVVPNEGDLELMPMEDVESLLKEIKKRRNGEEIQDEDPVEERLELAVNTLEKLARLGNGDHYGNSDGNCMAIQCLNKIT